MKLPIIALICVMLGMAAATTNYTQDAQAFTRPISFLNNVTFHGPIDISNASPISTEGTISGTTINASEGFAGNLTGDVTGDLTGTASRVPIGDFLDTGYGLKNSTANKMQVNLSADMGLMFDTGARAGALAVDPGDGIDVGAAGVSVDVTDIIDESRGLTETGTNNMSVNLSAISGLEFGSGSATGALKLDPVDASLTLASGGVSVRSGLIKRTLAAGTAAATNVTVSGMASGDELISIVAYTTAAAIASAADRTAEYSVGSGQLTKAAGTNETGNQLDILWLDRTA